MKLCLSATRRLGCVPGFRWAGSNFATPRTHAASFPHLLAWGMSTAQVAAMRGARRLDVDVSVGSAVVHPTSMAKVRARARFMGGSCRPSARSAHVKPMLNRDSDHGIRIE